MKQRIRNLLPLVLLVVSLTPLFAQTTGTSTGPSSTASTIPTIPSVTPPAGTQLPPVSTPLPVLNPDSNVPQGEPYKAEEFESFVLDLRRAEIIALGTLPFALILSGLGYDYWYWIEQGRTPALVPWPVGPGTSTFIGEPLNQKNRAVIFLGLGISAGVALLDWVLGVNWGGP